MFEKLRTAFRIGTPANHRRRPPSPGVRLSFVTLEDRTVPSATAAAATTTTETQADLDFLTKSIQGDEQEMILGSLAVVLGEGAGVRQFGNTLLHDHAEMYAAAVPLLAQNGLTLPAPDATMLQNIQQIASLRGSAFDAAFVDYMVQDHTTDLQDFRTEIFNGTGAIRTLAAQGRPLIREHLNIARSLQNVVGSETMSEPAGSSTATGTPSQQDTNFLMAAVQGDEQEMILGALAATIGGSEPVRDYGRMLFRDHAMMFASAMPILAQDSLTLSPPDSTMLQTMQQVGSQHGRGFAQAFVSAMVQDHTTDVQSFTTEIQSGSDQRIQDLALDNIATIEEHLNVAESLAGNDPTATKGK